MLRDAEGPQLCCATECARGRSRGRGRSSGDAGSDGTPVVWWPRSPGRGGTSACGGRQHLNSSSCSAFAVFAFPPKLPSSQPMSSTHIFAQGLNRRTSPALSL